jgi:CheY-like chemotaxis protein
MASDPIKILIVDDDEDVLIDLGHLLEDEGYWTATAWSGREALALSDKVQFDLLLVDDHLGDMEASALWAELQHRQPNAFRFLMHAPGENSLKHRATTHTAVCKWEHGDVKAKIRDYLAA